MDRGSAGPRARRQSSTPTTRSPLSSSHTALLCRHLGARDVLVGCDAHFADDDDADPSKPRLPRVDPWAPDEATVRRLAPTLILCAYDSTADALRDASPRWRLDGERDAGPPGGSFEVAIFAVRWAGTRPARLRRSSRSWRRWFASRQRQRARAGAALCDGLLALARARGDGTPRERRATVRLHRDGSRALLRRRMHPARRRARRGARGWKHRGRILGRFFLLRRRLARERRPDALPSTSSAAILVTSRAGLVDCRAPDEVRSGEDVVSRYDGRGGSKETRGAQRGTPRASVRRAVRRGESVDARTRGRRGGRARRDGLRGVHEGDCADGERNRRRGDCPRGRADANAATVEAAVEKNGSSKARPSRAPEGSYVGATPRIATRRRFARSSSR